MCPPAKVPPCQRGGREAAGGFPLSENISGALLLSVGAHSVRPRAAEVVGPYGVYRTGFCIFVGAGVLTRPPFPSARLEPRRRQRRFQKGEFQAFDYFPVSGSERRGESGQLSDPRLCDDCQARLIGGPRKMGVQGVSGMEAGAAQTRLPIALTPGASLASFWASRKKLAAGAAKLPSDFKL